MSFVLPTVSDFKTMFDREFNYAGADDAANLKKIRDTDVTKAIACADVNFNDCLFGTDDKAKLAFLFLTASFLVENLRNSTNGLASQARFPIASKTVGGVTVQFQVPTRFQADPFVALMAGNGYGLMYLSMALPAATGQIFISPGGPKP